ncbi:MAG: ATP-binding cassette domain-containing protein [Eisenbergiella massiliensis]
MIELSCSQLKKYYGAQLVLENITFEVQEGERVAVIGKNGCGKSTILKLITRVEAPDGMCLHSQNVTGYLDRCLFMKRK